MAFGNEVSFWSAYHSGFKAHLNGLSLTHNPFQSLSKLWHAWKDGWLEGKA